MIFPFFSFFNHAEAYSIFSSLKPTDLNITTYFGCEDNSVFIHCDPFKNGYEGFDYSSKSTTIANITRTPHYVDGKFGSGVYLQDRYSEFIDIPKNNLYNLSQFSISFWIKKINGTFQVNPHGQILSQVNYDRKNGWFFETNDSYVDSIRFVLTDHSGDPIISRPIPISGSEFTNIAITFNNSTINVYRNAVLYESLKYMGQYRPASNLPIHIGSPSYCDSCEQFSGIFDELAIYDKSLSRDAIYGIYLNGSDTTAKNNNSSFKDLIGHWSFNDNLSDNSVNENNAQMFTILSSMATSPDGRIFLSLKDTGEIKIWKNGTILDRPFAVINDSYVSWEQGLLGIAVDPNFKDNHFIYLYYTADKGVDGIVNRIVRLVDNDDVAKNVTVIFDNIPASRGYHSGGALAFGPDNKLYVTVGDATEHIYAQSISVPIGKILRINTDGSIPSDNPFNNSPVFTLGHRNLFGISFDFFDGLGIATENGDAFYDEINLIQKGGNYGFPTLQPPNISPELSNSTMDIKPLRSFWRTVGPTQSIYYIGDQFPLLKNRFLFGTFEGDIYAIGINKTTKNINEELHIQINHFPFEPVIALTSMPDGEIYYGSYHLYSLLSITKKNIDSVLFPIKLYHSFDVGIDKVQIEKGKSIILDLKNKFNNDNVSGYMTVEYPTHLMESVANITKTVDIPTYTNKIIKTDYLLKHTLKEDTLTFPIDINSTSVRITINGNNTK